MSSTENGIIFGNIGNYVVVMVTQNYLLGSHQIVIVTCDLVVMVICSVRCGWFNI